MARMLELWPSRKAVRGIVEVAQRLLQAFEEHTSTPSDLEPKRAVYNASEELERLLNPRRYASDHPHACCYDSRNWPADLIEGFASTQTGLDGLRRACRWDAPNQVEVSNGSPHGPDDIQGALLSGTISTVPLDLGEIAGEQIVSIRRGVESLQLALAAVESYPPDADVWQSDGQAEPESVQQERGLTSEEFNPLAHDYLKRHATPDHRVTVRELADYLKTQNPAGTCSTATAFGLPAMRAYQDELERRGEKGRKTKPKAVRFTETIEATTGEDDPELQRLIAESEAEDRSDPSPLEEDPPDSPPRQVRYRKRV